VINSSAENAANRQLKDRLLSALRGRIEVKGGEPEVFWKLVSEEGVKPIDLGAGIKACPVREDLGIYLLTNRRRQLFTLQLDLTPHCFGRS
jgi:hypothetical protein